MLHEFHNDEFEHLRKMRKVEQTGAIAGDMETSTSTVLSWSSTTAQGVQMLELLKTVDVSQRSSSEDLHESKDSHPSSPDSQSGITLSGVWSSTIQWQLAPEICRPLPDGDTCPPRRYYRSFWRSLTRRALNRL
jgi:hypothetical protein